MGLKSKITPKRIYFLSVMTAVLLISACSKNPTDSAETNKFIRVLAGYLNRVPGSHSPDSLRTTLLDSLCQEHDYAPAQFQKRLKQLNQKPEDWGPVMERVHNLMMQLKMPSPARPDTVSPAEPATPRP